MPDLLPLDEAVRRILSRSRRLRTGEVPLAEARGLRLAVDARADRDQPPFDRAVVDGYAVRSADPAGARGLAVVDTLFAGTAPRRRVGPGQSVLVMTGAPVPPGADAVLKREEAEPSADGARVRLLRRPGRGEGIHARGSDLGRGTVAVPAGTRITPAVLAVLASIGVARPRVVLPPRVAVGVTGDEILPHGTRSLPPAAIRNSNGPTVEALVRDAGAVAVSLGPAPDDPRELSRLVRRGLRAAEVLVLTGGVSAGDRDLVPAILRAAGVRRVFHGVDLKPGKPAWFGVRGTTLVFGLPGNPVSAQVTFAVLVAPALAALAGDPDPGPRLREAVLEAAVPAERSRTALRPARLRRGRDGVLRVRVVPWNGSGDMVGFAAADALLRRAAGAPALAAGARVEVLPLGELP